MTEKAQRTIYIKWVRSGIGFTHRQKNAIRSLGLRRLHHVVERVDTPQIRGLVARIPRLVEVVKELPGPALATSVPEYTILPKEALPAEALKAAKAASSKQRRPATAAEEPAEVAVQAEAVPVKAKPAKAAKAAKGDAAKEKKEKKAKAEKEPGKKKAKTAAKPAKAAKSSKK